MSGGFRLSCLRNVMLLKSAFFFPSKSMCILLMGPFPWLRYYLILFIFLDWAIMFLTSSWNKFYTAFNFPFKVLRFLWLRVIGLNLLLNIYVSNFLRLIHILELLFSLLRILCTHIHAVCYIGNTLMLFVFSLKLVILLFENRTQIIAFYACVL